MGKRRLSWCAWLAGMALMAAGVAMQAEEGMWTFDNPPLKTLATKYNFTPTPEWLDHLRLASVRNSVTPCTS